ncbi:hypothetical protein C5167_013952 [Papaver somniferum]|uniref:BED-type domain-containing protein n=1 Tax=Papaver somniferum TaxID=3469 RepID=A0A4Y7J3T8_PAPSO|nr:hypothetical protein C5167_013952 [Papaver somniferum]
MKESGSTSASVNSNAMFPSSPAANVSEAGTATAPAPKKRKQTSWVWEHLEKDPQPSILAPCKMCKLRLKAGMKKNVTRSLITHLKKCKLERRFKVPSRVTIRRDVIELFAYEKKRLKNKSGGANAEIESRV